MTFFNATTNPVVTKIIMQTKEASKIYPVQTTGGGKTTSAYLFLLFINIDCFWVIFWRFSDVLNNQEIQDGGSKMVAVGISWCTCNRLNINSQISVRSNSFSVTSSYWLTAFSWSGHILNWTFLDHFHMNFPDETFYSKNNFIMRNVPEKKNKKKTLNSKTIDV